MNGIVKVKVPKGTWPFRWQVQGFAFSMYSWGMMLGYLGIDVDEIEQQSKDKLTFVSIWAAAKSFDDLYANKHQKYTPDDVREWCKKMPQESFEKVITTLMESKIGGKTVQDYNEDEKKK